ncbi:HIT-like protein [Atractiella rhizophila]|nr:HIT-like protein [Atractiella rhizophila]
MSDTFQPSKFGLVRVLGEDIRTRSIHLLGNYDQQSCILSLEKTSFDSTSISTLFASNQWEKVEQEIVNDVYQTHWGWRSNDRGPDVKMSVIFPATEKHISKYESQSFRMIRETPELYHNVVQPYIDSLPKDRINWVYNILSGVTEQEKVLFRDPDPETGFVLLPDMKWDLSTFASLYLLVISNSPIQSVRSLRPKHLPLLRNIKREVERVTIENWGEKGMQTKELRMFVHYQPSYYHFHVHVTHINYFSFAGITVGQSHLLDDIIDNLESEETLDLPDDKSYYARRTLTYGLGIKHPLFQGLWKGMGMDELA